MGISSSVCGFTFAFVWGWKLSLILLVGLPLLGGVGITIFIQMRKGVAENLKAYAQSSGYAEQALSAIKVVQTYGQETLEINNYNKYLERSRLIGKKQVFKSAMGGASFYLMINGFYAYTFYWGGYLRYNKVMQGDREYSGGSIIAIMFCVIIGCF